MARKDQLRMGEQQFQAIARLGPSRKEETSSRTAAYYILVEGMSIKDAANRAGCTYTAAYVAVRKLDARYEQAQSRMGTVPIATQDAGATSGAINVGDVA